MKVLTLVLVLGLAGCVSLTPEAARIVVMHNPNVVRGCTSLGEVRASSLWTNYGGILGLLLGNGADLGYENNEREMRRVAAERGGTALLMLQERVGGLDLRSLGEVYRCP